MDSKKKHSKDHKKKSRNKRKKQKAFADSYITANASNFNSNDIYLLKDKLSQLSTRRQTSVQSVPLKNPILALILSLFFGTFGIDRFYLGDIGLGIGKLLTLGGFGFWTIIDWFFIMKATRKKNFEKVMTII